MCLPSTRGGLSLFAAIAVLAAVPLVAFGAGTQDHTHNHDPKSGSDRLHTGTTLIELRQVYLETCASCHGPRGQGTAAAPINFSDPGALVRLTQAAITDALEKRHFGRLTHPLAAEEQAAIAGYLRNYLMLPAPDADTDVGRAIYARSCSVCHGDRGDSASWAKNSLFPAPADFTKHGLEAVSRAKMIEAVTFGKDDTAMMPFAVQLSREEIAATVDYIRAAFMVEGMGEEMHGHDHGTVAEGHQGNAEAEDKPFSDGLVGDPVWGRAFYNANCAECHGEDGDGRGRRAYFMLIKPEDFTSREAAAELDRPKLFEEISHGVTGTTMPAWRAVLTEQQIANVAEYVYQAFLHPEQLGNAGNLAPAWKNMTDELGTKKN